MELGEDPCRICGLGIALYCAYSGFPHTLGLAYGHTRGFDIRKGYQLTPLNYSNIMLLYHLVL